MARFITGVAVGVTVGYLFSDLIDELLERVPETVTYKPMSGEKTPIPVPDVEASYTSQARIEELDAATVENPVKLTIDEVRELAKRKNMSLTSVLTSGRWLISDDEDGTVVS